MIEPKNPEENQAKWVEKENDVQNPEKFEHQMLEGLTEKWPATQSALHCPVNTGANATRIPREGGQYSIY